MIREIFNFNLTGVSDLENVSEQYNNKGGTFYVAIEESKTSSNKHGSNKQVKNKYIRSKLIGTIGVYKSSKGFIRVRRMYVHEAYRCKGIGQRLMNKVFDFCKQKQYHKLVLSTYPQMKAAIKYYKGNGFKKIGVAKDNAIIFEKNI